MSFKVVSVGELLVEIMRDEVGVPLKVPGRFLGPFPSGAPGIFIDCIAKLGIPCSFIGTVGNDGFGELILNRFRESGVDISNIRISKEHTTGVAFIAYRKDGSREFVFHFDKAASGNIRESQVRHEIFKGVEWLHIAGSTITANEMCRQSGYKAIQIAKAEGASVCFDPNIRPELVDINRIQAICDPILKRTDLLMPSAKEACLLAGIESEEEACLELKKSGVKAVVLKRGAQGCRIYVDDKTIDVPSFTVEEVDPTGAGDSFDAGFVYGMIQGWDWEKCGKFANGIGALSVMKFGPMEGAPTLKEALEFTGI
jgi:sugar/nucleoside kinase (ribokinase family)